MLAKGDKIRLVKPMGAFVNVGEVCDVMEVTDNGVISFKFGGVHRGCMSYDEFEKYFEKVVEEQKNVAAYKVGDTAQLIVENEALAPMKSGSEYAIQSIAYGVVSLLSIDTGEVRTISQGLFEANFAIVHNEEDVMDESGAFTGEIPVGVSIKRVEEVMNHSKVVVYKAFDKCTVVVCQLPSGFVIVESSSCVDPKNYNEQMGVEICMNRIKDRIFEMEAYKLQEDILMMNKAIEQISKMPIGILN